MVGGALGAVYYYQRVARELPDVALLSSFRPSLVTRVYDRDGGLLREFFIERRFLLKPDEIPAVVVRATLATEDARFREHPGVDLVGILRAALRNFTDWGIVEGGSTITQQLAKTLFLTPERTLARKLREVVLAVRIERRFSKNEILNFYLNQIYYGHGAYGIEAAARTYFGKHARDLDLAQAALLAGLPRAPARYSPFKSKRLARQRRLHVLRRMWEEGFINAFEREMAARAPIILAKPSKDEDEVQYPVEYVRQRVAHLFSTNDLYSGGLKVYTTLGCAAQREATAAVRRGILALDRRRGYRGAIGRVDTRWKPGRLRKMLSVFMEEKEVWPEVRSGQWEPAVVEGVRRAEASLRLEGGPAVLALADAKWARPFDPSRNWSGTELRDLRRSLHPGDVVLVERLPGGSGPARAPARVALVQTPQVQGAALVIEPSSGAIRAMVGGYEFDQSQFNRAVQAVRPPGSAFKPVTYSAALSEGWTPADVIVDAPVVYPNGAAGGDWKPTNFENRFYGPTTLREALTRSRNVVTVKLADAVGLKKVVARARALGIRSPLPQNLSIALGSSGVTLVELTSMYATLANLGRWVEPHVLRRIEDAEGKTIWAASPQVRQAIPSEQAYVLLNLLEQVVRYGTATRAQVLGRPVAGKTGTTNDFQDAWFIGATPQYAAGVWVGMDDKSTLGRGETGSRAALPIWIDIARSLHEGLPVKDFSRPPKVEMVYLNPKTGERVTPLHAGAVLQAFMPGTAPELPETKQALDEDQVDLFRSRSAPLEDGGRDRESPAMSPGTGGQSVAPSRVQTSRPSFEPFRQDMQDRR